MQRFYRTVVAGSVAWYSLFSVANAASPEWMRDMQIQEEARKCADNGGTYSGRTCTYPEKPREKENSGSGVGGLVAGGILAAIICAAIKDCREAVAGK